MDAQSKDAQSKDAQSKDARSKDARSKDARSKDAQSKDAQSKDAQSKDAQSKDALTMIRSQSGERSTLTTGAAVRITGVADQLRPSCAWLVVRIGWYVGLEGRRGKILPNRSTCVDQSPHLCCIPFTFAPVSYCFASR
jgi:pentapeptide MXKDX repeat protein